MRGKVAAFVASVAVLLLVAFGVSDPLELPLRDLLVRTLPSRSAGRTIIIAIDEASIRELGPWPWSRVVLARLVDRAVESGARAVILDTLLAEPRPGDELLAASLHRLPAIAVAVLDERDQWLGPAATLAGAAVPAHGVFELDHDGILRRLSATKQNRDRSLTALSLEAASIITSRPIPVGQSVSPSFRTPPGSIPLISAAALLRESKPDLRLRNRLVFIGPTALALGDRVLTPTSSRLRSDPGVTVQASATESLIRDERLRPLPPLISSLLAALLVLVIYRPARTSRRAALAGTLLLIVFAGAFLLLSAGVTIPAGTLAILIVITATGLEALRAMSALQQTNAAATRMESGLGMRAPASSMEIAPRLEEIATRLVEQREEDVESRRVLAHELKTPLSSMRGLSQLLAGFELSDAERNRVASMLESEAGKLQLMVQELLELERLSSRDFATSSNVIDLSAVTEARVRFLQASTERMLQLSTDRGVMIQADVMLVERVIDNLVGNAMKYSTSGTPVTISVRAAAHRALLEVSDEGPGVPAMERDRIFQRFVRGDRARGTQGLGLGLSFVAEIARWHGGSVSLEPSPAGGSSFQVQLPLHEEGRSSWRAS